MDIVPPFEVRTRLGAGGGGEVWAGVDALTGEPCAIKVLALDSSRAELDALLAEATALSGLEGLGLPRVLAFGTLADGRRYLVREMIDGKSLESYAQSGAAPTRFLLGALSTALEQLGVLHRAGMFHGDVKPANIIVDPDGVGRLVDLGLAVRATGGRASPRGLTPAFAAPELFEGAPSSAATEVFAAGRALGTLLEHDTSLSETVRASATALVARATATEPSRRFPSVDELRVELMHLLGHREPLFTATRAWRVLGIDEEVAALLDRVRSLGKGRVLVLAGSPRAGKSTLIRRLAWTLGASGTRTAFFDAARLPDPALLAPAIARLASPESTLIALDDARVARVPSVKAALEAALRAGARIVLVAESERPTTIDGVIADAIDGAYVVKALSRADAEELVQTSMPSLPKAHVDAVIERTGALPGALRDAITRIGSRVVASRADLDEALAAAPGALGASKDALVDLERAIVRGRFAEAARVLALITRPGAPPLDLSARVRVGIAESKMSLARGDAERAARALDAIEGDLPADLTAPWRVARARVYLRLGEFKTARASALEAKAGSPALEAEALAVAGVAAAYSGDDDADEVLGRAREVAREAGDARTSGIVYGSIGIAAQRAGRRADARAAFALSLGHSEAAADAWTLTTTHLNLAVLHQGEGELGDAVTHLEAGADLARRAGMPLLLAQALLNLANLDLYLGRNARARRGLDALRDGESTLTAPLRAQLAGLEADAQEREGHATEAARLYERCAASYEDLGRSLDAFEARLARALLLAEDAATPKGEAARVLEALLNARPEAEQGEHLAMAWYVTAVVRAREDRTDEALRLADRAIAAAEESARTEWKWRALGLRATLHDAKGATHLGRRDLEAAMETLERVATRLPTDLGAVFWSDPKRAAIRARTRETSTPLAPNARSRHAISNHRGGSTLSHTWALSQLSDDRLQRILEITKELARERDMQALLRGIVDHAISLASAERGLVLLLGNDGGLYVHTARDRKDDAEYIAFSKSVAERVLESNEAVVSNSTRDDAMFSESASVHKMMIQSVVCVPIRGAPPALAPIGALYLETRKRAGARFQEELPMLTAFADQAAIAIEYARLIEENRARAAELEVTNAELERAKERLASTLDRRTEQLHKTRRDLRDMRAQLSSHFGYGSLVGTSAAMRSLYALIDRVRDTDIPILVLGESGTGKEVVARTIHSMSARSKKPFLGINCGAIPHNLLESELFGHVRGAFTGADRDRRGVFRQAEDGTLLLDEIGELPAAMQAGFLRVLQEKVVRPVGAELEEPVSARIIAATNRSLEEMVERGQFREDLYYRLNVVSVRVPSLRERREDIPMLVDHFLSRFASRYDRARKTIHKDALARLMRHEFPGNVRELEHMLLGAWLMGDDDVIGPADIEIGAPRSRSMAPPSTPTPVESNRGANAESFKQTERERIVRALRDANWNRLRAAEILGMPRRTLYRRLKEYGIQ